MAAFVEPYRPAAGVHGHEGYEWLYVLNGRLRLVLGGESIDLVTGEAAEFDTRIPHWFGASGSEPVEILALLGTQGERAHLRTTTPTSGGARAEA
ncbi:cupin domain-containing protein [Actinophytocola gossypii]